ncbi:MAG: hypothetical protein Q8S73_24470 [Deltaproteobacteria bacterium]|nr:hypothetical protein [Myxococcales bacterium]MDP3217289.1 hypothetical protein [Deltaproteobacteria bacterium]
MAHLDIAPPAPASTAAPEACPLPALCARARRRARDFAHLADALPEDLSPEQRLLVDRALDAVGVALAQVLAAAGLQRSRASAPPSVTPEAAAHFVGFNAVVGER